MNYYSSMKKMEQNFHLKVIAALWVVAGIKSPLKNGDSGGCKITLIEKDDKKKHNPLNRSTELTTKSSFAKGD